MFQIHMYIGRPTPQVRRHISDRCMTKGLTQFILWGNYGVYKIISNAGWNARVLIKQQRRVSILTALAERHAVNNQRPTVVE